MFELWLKMKVRRYEIDQYNKDNKDIIVLRDEKSVPHF